MNTQTILQISLVLHLIALAMAVGITIANAVAFKQFWKLYDANKEHGLAAFRAITKFQLFGIVGLSLLILSGITMLWLSQWTFVELLSFKIKMSLVVLLFVNGFTLGRTTTLKLQKLLSEEKQPDELQTETTRLRRNLQIFHLTQLSIFTMIIIFAVFRFT
jgi:uncharacterized membrane protein YbjE (DUF340 family)